jgi:hypothetical protein
VSLDRALSEAAGRHRDENRTGKVQGEAVGCTLAASREPKMEIPVITNDNRGEVVMRFSDSKPTSAKIGQGSLSATSQEIKSSGVQLCRPGFRTDNPGLRMSG